MSHLSHFELSLICSGLCLDLEEGVDECLHLGSPQWASGGDIVGYSKVVCVKMRGPQSH